MENNIFIIINTKRSQLLARKRSLTADYKKRLAEIDSELNDLDKAINTIKQAIEPYVCPVCKGTGYVRESDAAGQMEDVRCETCHGTCIKTTG